MLAILMQEIAKHVKENRSHGDLIGVGGNQLRKYFHKRSRKGAEQ
jgi:hypothetical protein